MIGKTISHYKILEKLGEGGMGVVYKAEDTKLERIVALKFLSERRSGGEEENARFLREAKAAAALDHPNICSVYDVAEADGQNFIVMAYCDGRSLQEKIGSVPLGIDEAVGIAVQVAEGLKEAHKRGVIHRDIKSANIMVTNDGQAKIMDFGLAKLVGRTQLTDSATIMGTVDYMSPEQAGGEPVDHRTDIWSLGVVLYEMLTANKPFDAPSNAAVVHKIIYDDPAKLESLNPDLPPGLSAVVTRAMAKNREDRYASVTELLEDLRNYESLPPEKLALAGKPAGTRPISTARPVPSKRVKRGIAAAVVAALVCLCVALIWFFQRPEPAEKAKPSKKDQEIHFCTTSDGVRIAYATSGEGDPPLVRVLGWFTHLEYEWENPLTRAFYNTLGAGHLFVRYDGRGMGLSDRQVSDFSLEGRVRDLEAVVDALGLERFALYALSEGGPTAITYAVRHPERVSHLILYGSWARGRQFRDTVEERQKLEAMIMMVRQGWGSDVPAHRQYFTGLFIPDADGEAIRVFTELQRVSTSAENAIAKISVSHEIDVRLLLKQVRVPTLVIHRRGDAIVPFEMGREVAAGIPDARFLSLDGRNHTILPDEPELGILKRTMEQFLSEDFEATAKAVPISEEKAFSSIAVLPFEDMSAEKDQEYFCDGISEELINALSRLEDLRVIARTSAFSFKGKDVDIQDIGDKLNVETVLEGSVRRSGDRVRITAQLVNVADSSHLWSERYEKEMKDIFAIQDEITEAIVDNLKIELMGVERTTIAKRHDVDPEVYDLYLRGRFFWRKMTPTTTERSIQCFIQALEKDPNYAPAYAGLADSYLWLLMNPLVPTQEAFPKAREAALKALEIDDKLAEAHAVLGVIKGMYEWDLGGAERELKLALELSPGYAPAHHYYAWYLTLTARFEEGIREIQQARELDPFSIIINKDVGTLLYYARQYDRAIDAHKKTIEMAPNLPYAHAHLAYVYLEKGMYEEALAEFEAERQASGFSNPDTDRWIGITYARMGRRDEAQKVLDDLLERSKEEHVPTAFFATLYFALGENDKGFEWLDKAYENRDYILPFLKVALTFDPARSDPRYTAMLKKINLDK